MEALKKVLIIEDELMFVNVLSQYLLQYFDVHSASDGMTGLQKVKEQLPDIIILDLFLPGMHGFDVLKQIKEDPETANIPVIILSNLGSDNDIEEGFKLGATEYLIKAEVNPEIVKLKIDLALGTGLV